MTVGRVDGRGLIIGKYLQNFYLLVCFLFSAPLHARISMSDQSMIAHAHDECARRVLFSLTSFIVGTILNH